LEHSVEAELQSLLEPFEHSKPIGPWLVDFLLTNRRAVIECDGSYWHSKPEVAARDRRKDAWLAEHGYRIVRLSESSIRENVRGAVRAGIARLAA
jgi:BirA family biotin operon repressor/biotin-[acetyl-CoA-carboxylase] ligase